MSFASLFSGRGISQPQPFPGGIMDQYAPFVSDSQVGFLLMAVAVLCIGMEYGIRLTRDRNLRNLGFPKSLPGALFVYHVGALMYASGFRIVGVYAYLTYATMVFMNGLVAAAIATGFSWFFLEILSRAFTSLRTLTRSVWGLARRCYLVYSAGIARRVVAVSDSLVVWLYNAAASLYKKRIASRSKSVS